MNVIEHQSCVRVFHLVSQWREKCLKNAFEKSFEIWYKKLGSR